MRPARKLRLSMLLLPVLVGAASPVLSITWPIHCGRYLAPITSAFGPRCTPQYSFHAGIDVRIWETRDVVAVATGTVATVEFRSGYDWTVILRHGSGETAWYSGYHHMDTQDDVVVVPGQPVAEGQKVANAGSDHLHFNYWKCVEVPMDDDDTKHPLRLFGDEGAFSINVSCPCVPQSGVVVTHCGQLLEAGAGLAWSPFGSPFWTYVWHYEGNVRSYGTTWGYYVPGDCYRGESSTIGVSPTAFEAYQTTYTFFVFPAYQGSWLLPSCTYAISANGHRISIDRPISGFFQDITGTVEDGTVVIDWTISADGLSSNDFVVLKGMSRESTRQCGVPVRQTGERSFQASDTEVEPGVTYFYRVAYEDAGVSTAETMTIGITMPGGQLPISISPPSPNPFRENASSVCLVPVQKEYDVSVYDVAGRRIRSIRSGLASGDRFTVVWDGTDDEGKRVSDGCYFLTLSVDGHRSSTEKLFLVE